MFSGASGGLVLESDAVARLYRPKETYSERVTTFLTKPQALRFTRLLQVWTALDRVQNPEGKEWTEAEGARRLIDASLEAAFTELGGEPKTEEEMNKVIARLVAEAKKAK
jgi:hypothetical protein